MVLGVLETLDTLLTFHISQNQSQRFPEWLNNIGKKNRNLLAMQNKHEKEQKDNEAWIIAQKEHTHESYTQYLNSFPKGRFCQLAIFNKNVLEAEEIRKREKEEQILKDKKTKDIEQKRKNQLKNDIEKEVFIWNQTVEKNTKEAYMIYLEKYPQGFYVDKAKVKLEKTSISFFIKKIFK